VAAGAFYCFTHEIARGIRPAAVDLLLGFDALDGFADHVNSSCGFSQLSEAGFGKGRRALKVS
jgi:hypothetical protein